MRRRISYTATQDLRDYVVSQWSHYKCSLGDYAGYNAVPHNVYRSVWATFEEIMDFISKLPPHERARIKEKFPLIDEKNDQHKALVLASISAA